MKRRLLTDGRGIPLGVAVEGANRHDCKLVQATLASQVLERPDCDGVPQNLCLDKGFDFDFVRKLVSCWGYTAHIRTRGEEKQEKAQVPGYRARRWGVERTHSWMNRFRRLLVRWEKKEEDYLGLLHFALAWITFQAARLFG